VSVLPTLNIYVVFRSGMYKYRISS
jgi:hypothetical protein